MAFERAYKFVYEQRIRELKKAIEYWPSSVLLGKRIQELSELETKLEEVNKRLLSE